MAAALKACSAPFCTAVKNHRQLPAVVVCTSLCVYYGHPVHGHCSGSTTVCVVLYGRFIACELYLAACLLSSFFPTLVVEW